MSTTDTPKSRETELLEQILEETSRTRRSSVYVNGNEALRDVQWSAVKWITITAFITVIAARWNWAGIAFLVTVGALFIGKLIWHVQEFRAGYKEAMNSDKVEEAVAD